MTPSWPRVRAQAKWWSQTAYNRGQVIYRLAEMAESRRDELTEHVGLAEGLKGKAAQQSVARSIDRIVWYAGWTDKIAQILGSSNPGRRTVFQLLGSGAQRGRGRP